MVHLHGAGVSESAQMGKHRLARVTGFQEPRRVPGKAGQRPSPQARTVLLGKTFPCTWFPGRPLCSSGQAGTRVAVMSLPQPGAAREVRAGRWGGLGPLVATSRQQRVRTTPLPHGMPPCELEKKGTHSLGRKQRGLLDASAPGDMLTRSPEGCPRLHASITLSFPLQTWTNVS